VRLSALLFAIFLVPSASAGEFTLAGSIPFKDVIHVLEWTTPGYDYGDSRIRVWYRPSDGCFPSDADAVDLVRQWILRDVQDHRINGIKLYCQEDSSGAVVVLADADFEQGMPKRLYFYHMDGEGLGLGQQLFDVPGAGPWPMTGFQFDFVIEQGKVTRVVFLEEYPERPGSRPWADLTVRDLRGKEIHLFYMFTVLEMYRVDTVDSRSFLFLGWKTTPDWEHRLVAGQVGEKLIQITRENPAIGLSKDIIGPKAARQLEDVEAVVSQFEATVKSEHAVRMFKSDFIERHVKELKRRRALKSLDPRQGE